MDRRILRADLVEAGALLERAVLYPPTRAGLIYRSLLMRFCTQENRSFLRRQRDSFLAVLIARLVSLELILSACRGRE
jgi:hypothetical protein